jgi:O-antigen/teichoic acid export membrane protein
MSKKQFLLDSLLNIVATAIPIIILQLVTLPIIGDRLGGDQYGLIVTLISLFTVLSFPFGNVLNNIRLLVDKEYSEKQIFGDFNILLISSIVLSTIMMIIGTIYYEGKFSFISISLIILISCFNLLREYLGVSFRLQLNFKKIVINNVILTIGYILGTFLFSLMGYWQFIFIFGYGFSVLYIIKNSTLLKEPVVRTDLFNSTTYKSIVLLGSSLLTNVLNYADKLLIFPLLGPAAVTIYYTATIIGKIMSMAITPINGVILSYIARLEKFNQKSFGSIMLLIGIVGIVGYVFTIWISPFVLGFLYPDWANESLKYIYITTATAIVGVISSVIQPFILKFNHINWQLIINGSNVIVYMVCAFVLFQFYGLMGFCIGIFISSVYQLILMICIFIVSNRRNHEEHVMGE